MEQNNNIQTRKRQRTCVTCGNQGQKGTLFRIVRNVEGVVSFDPTGRAAGRGAYVCSVDCFESACKTGKLNRSLKCGLSGEDYQRIASAFAEALREAR